MDIRWALTRLFRGQYAERGLTPAQVFGKGLDDYLDLQAATGYTVTAERLMDAAFGDAVALLADDISGLPVDVYARRGREIVPLATPDWLKRPSGRVHDTTGNYLSDIVVSIGTESIAYILAQPSILNIETLRVLDARKVMPFEEGGRRLYRVSDGERGVYGDGNIIEIPWRRLPGQLKPEPMSRKAKESVGLELAAMEWAGSFFANGATMGGVIEVPREAGNLSPDQKKDLREYFGAQHVGRRKSWRFGILEGGAHFNADTINPQQAELDPLWRHCLEVAARTFHIPPHLLASQDPGAAARASVEERGIGYVRHAVRNFTTKIENAHTPLLRQAFGDESVFMKLNLNALMRGDAKTRAEFYHTLLEDKVMRREEVRELEDLAWLGELGWLETPNNNRPDGEAPTRAEPFSLSIHEAPVTVASGAPDIRVESAPQVHVDSVQLGDQAIAALADSATDGISAGIVVLGREHAQDIDRAVVLISERMQQQHTDVTTRQDAQDERTARIEARLQAAEEREMERSIPIDTHLEYDERGQTTHIVKRQGKRVDRFRLDKMDDGRVIGMVAEK